MKAKVLVVLVTGFFIAGIIYLTYYLTRRQLTKADFPLLPAPTATTTTASPTPDSSAPPAGSGKEQTELTLQLSAGFNSVSFGHRLAPSDCKNVFAKLSSKEVFALVQGKWVSCFTEAEWSLAPGEGYFVNSKNGENLKIPSTATSVSSDERFSFELAKGWNAVDNPFPKAFKLDPTKLEAQFGEKTLTLKEAIDKQHLSPLHRYNPIGRSFEEVKDGETIQLNQGLIVQSSAKGKLIFPGPGE